MAQRRHVGNRTPSQTRGALAGAILASLLLAVLAGALPARAEESASLKVGDLVPDFTLRNGLAAGEVNFAGDIKGKAAVSAIVFFNTGCSACLAELDEICKVAKDLGDEKLRVYAIAVDKRGEQSVKAYYEIYKYQATYLLDPTFTLPPKFGFTYTPASLLVDREGRIAFMRGGYDPIKDSGVFAREIANLVK